MPISLHAATIPTWLQILGACKGWLEKAGASDIPESELMAAQLIEDMFPFSYQVKSMTIHSRGAIEGVLKGSFSPDMSEPPATFSGLGEQLDETIAMLSGVTEEELDSLIDKDMVFEVPSRDIRLPFTAGDFLLTFSQPNFYFHATTAYDILRARGVPVGKLDYLGQMRIKA